VKDDGTLWFLLFEDGGAGTPALYSYDPVRDSRSRFALPESYGSMLFSAVAIARGGHVVAAYGNVVVDFDPVTHAQREIRLPDPPANFFELEPPEGSWVTDMAIDEQGRLLLGRSRTSSVTVVDIETGSIAVIPLPKSFGSVKEIAVAKNGIYLSNVYGEPGIERQAGVLSLDGEFTPLPLTVNVFAADPQGAVYASSPDDGNLYLLSGASAAVLRRGDGILTGAGDHVLWDSKSGTLWAAGEGTGNIARVIPASGAVELYALPVYERPLLSCPPDLPCPPSDATTLVGGLAVGPDGTVYFSDLTVGRIGVIKAGQ
jgi:streptogramin lyase